MCRYMSIYKFSKNDFFILVLSNPPLILVNLILLNVYVSSFIFNIVNLVVKDFTNSVLPQLNVVIYKNLKRVKRYYKYRVR